MKVLCSMCPIILEKDSLKAHMRLHKEIDLFSCEVCGKKFQVKKYLSIHIKIHEKTSFPCEICESMFQSKNDLSAHIKVHKEKVVFQCSLCETNYSSKGNLKKHNIVVHEFCTKFSTHLKGFTNPLLVSLWDIFICFKLMKINCTAQNKYRKYGLYKGISSLFFHHS